MAQPKDDKQERGASQASWEVLKDGKPANVEQVLILEGNAKALEEVRKLLASREHWLKEMRGVSMVKW